MDARTADNAKTVAPRRKPARAQIQVVDAPIPAEPTTAANILAAEQRNGSLSPSLHLLNLKGTSKKPAPAPAKPMRWPFFSAWEDKAHLRDFQARSLSVRPRDAWEFPPVGAKDMGGAMGSAARMAFKTLFFTYTTAIKTPVSAVPKIVPKIAPKPVTTAKVVAKVTVTQTPKITVTKANTPVAAAPAPKKVAATKPLKIPMPARPLVTTFRFAAAAVAIMLPFGFIAATRSLGTLKTATIADAKLAAESMMLAADAAKKGDFKTAEHNFGEASKGFQAVDNRLGALGVIIRPVAKILPVKHALLAAPLLVDAGRDLADSGESLTASIARLEPNAAPSQKMMTMSAALRQNLPRIERALASLLRIEPTALPTEYQAQFAQAKLEGPRLVDSLRRTDILASLIADAAGAAGTRRYLLVFQNNAELRATGGFIGSFALLDVSKGEIANLEMPGGGSYDLQGSLKARYAAPQPMRLINPNWQFQDSNWSPDFPTSAETISWFYEKSGGPTVDGVIAINASFMEKLLEVTGPVAMPEYGKTITARNFFFETQKQVELEYDKAKNKPKQFLSDLSPKLLERIMKSDRDSFIKLAGALDQGLASKDLLVWFKDENLERRAGALGWTGTMTPGDSDTLAIIHTNIAGQKTDGVMDEVIDHRTKILPDGSATVTLTISRTHTGKKNALFNGVRNVDYMRIYAPAGSRLIVATGYEAPDPKLFKIPDAGHETHPALESEESASAIDPASGTKTWDENGMTVFGNWVQTDPGETSVTKLIYTLPAKAVKIERPTGFNAIFAKDIRPSMSYSLLVRKQSGAKPARLTSSIELPRGYSPAWQSPLRTADADGRWSLTQTLDRDLFLAAVAR